MPYTQHNAYKSQITPNYTNPHYKTYKSAITIHLHIHSYQRDYRLPVSMQLIPSKIHCTIPKTLKNIKVNKTLTISAKR